MNDDVVEYKRIDINENQELDYWTGKLACSEVDLRLAVAAVGPQVEDICDHLGARSHRVAS